MLVGSVRRAMTVVAGILPFLFLMMFIGTAAEPTWTKVVVFLLFVVFAYLAAILFGELEEIKP